MSALPEFCATTRLGCAPSLKRGRTMPAHGPWRNRSHAALNAAWCDGWREMPRHLFLSQLSETIARLLKLVPLTFCYPIYRAAVAVRKWGI